MSCNVVNLIADDERRVLDAFVVGADDDPGLAAIFDRWGVPAETYCPRLAAAVAQILLHGIQQSLPQWGVARDDTMQYARDVLRRDAGSRLQFAPVLVGEINWACSGPGYDWPEAYHITRVPGLERWIVTASRDSPDVWGCTDHAIACLPGQLSIDDAARIGVVGFWAGMVAQAPQPRWEEVLCNGSELDADLLTWALEVWPDVVEEDEEDEED